MIATIHDWITRRRWVHTRRAATVTELAQRVGAAEARADAAEQMAEAAHLDLVTEEEAHRVTKSALARCRTDLASQIEQAVSR